MRHVIVAVAFVALAACTSGSSAAVSTRPATPATPATPTNSASDIFSPLSLPGVVYTETAGGYRFNHDTSWTVAVQDKPTNVVVSGPPDAKTTPSNVSIQLLGAPAGIDMNTYAREDLAFLQAIPGGKVVSARGERLGDQPAYSIQYLLTANGERVEVLQLTTVSNSQVFSVTYSSTPARFKQDLIGAGLIARSFTFTAPPDQPRDGIKAPVNGRQVFPIPVRTH